MLILRTIRLQWNRISEKLTWNIPRNFSKNKSEFFLGIFSKICLKISEVESLDYPILLSKNSDLNLLWKFYLELTRNLLDIFPMEWNFLGFSPNFFYGKNLKLLRKDSNPSYLRVGKLFFDRFLLFIVK
jgi:hypothetical protein